MVFVDANYRRNMDDALAAKLCVPNTSTQWKKS
jgi:hypothetical protein